MDKKLMKYCGSLQQMVYARPIVYKEGRAEHMNAIEAKCGDIFFHSAADKALDITDFSYKGMNMTPTERKRFEASWAGCSSPVAWKISALPAP